MARRASRLSRSGRPRRLLLPADDEAGRRRRVPRAHIPGAQRFDIDVVKDPDSDLPHMMPSATVFSAACRKLGIGDGKSVLVYDSLGLFSAPRVWWMFRTFGAERVFIILDGGLPKWVAEGRPGAGRSPHARARRVISRHGRNHGAVADLGDVKKALAAARFRSSMPARPSGSAARRPSHGQASGVAHARLPQRSLFRAGRETAAWCRRTASAPPSPRLASISTGRSSPAADRASSAGILWLGSTPGATSPPAFMTAPGASGVHGRIAR